MTRKSIRCPECGSENVDRLYDAEKEKITIIVKCLFCGSKWGGVLKPM
jgi:uncharacterized Zn finger protein